VRIKQRGPTGQTLPVGARDEHLFGVKACWLRPTRRCLARVRRRRTRRCGSRRPDLGQAGGGLVRCGSGRRVGGGVPPCGRVRQGRATGGSTGEAVGGGQLLDQRVELLTGRGIGFCVASFLGLVELLFQLGDPALVVRAGGLVDDRLAQPSVASPASAACEGGIDRAPVPSAIRSMTWNSRPGSASRRPRSRSPLVSRKVTTRPRGADAAAVRRRRPAVAPGGGRP
jgi:hypothetical protein